MVKIIGLFLMCNVASWQLSSGNSGSPANMEKIMQMFEDASKGLEILNSLPDAIEESPTGLYLNGLPEIVMKIATTIPAIGAVFSLSARLNANDQSTERLVVVEELQEIGLYYEQLNATISQHTSVERPDAFRTFMQYQRLVNNHYVQYNKFIKDATCNQCRDNFTLSCGAAETDPRTNLLHMHETIVKRGNSISELMNFLLTDVGYNWKKLRSHMQVIMSGVVKAVIMSQACLGLGNPDDYIAYRRQAKADEHKIREIVEELQKTVDLLVRNAHENRWEHEVLEKFNSLDSRSSGNFTIHIKELLDKKYPWLIWNVYTFGKNPEVAKIAPTDNQVRSFTGASKPHVVITFSDVNTYKRKQNCLKNMKRDIEILYSRKNCTDIDNRNIGELVSTSKSCADSYIVGDLSSDVFSAISDNTLAFRICKFYIALSVLGRVS